MNTQILALYLPASRAAPACVSNSAMFMCASRDAACSGERPAREAVVGEARRDKRISTHLPIRNETRLRS